jgi:ABC-type lipoprotein release transport system permease subunit
MEHLHLAPKVLVPLGIALALVVAMAGLGRIPLSYNVRNLLVRWRITLLTALAFTLVVCLLTVMLAFVNGMSRLTEASAQPANVIVLSDGATDELFSNLAKSDTTNLERQPGVSRDDKNRPLCSKEVYIVVNQPIPPPPDPKVTNVRGKVKNVVFEKNELVVTDDEDKDWTFKVDEKLRDPFQRIKVEDKILVVYQQSGKDLLATDFRGSSRRRFVQVRGIEDPAISSQVHAMELYPGGQWFSEAGVQESAKKDSQQGALPEVQAVLGEGVARILGQDQGKERLENGDHFELGPRKWIVTGIMKSAGSAFGSEIWAKHSIVGPMFGKDQFTCLVVRTDSADKAEGVAKFLKEEYRPPVRAETEPEYYAKLGETNKQFSIAIYFVTIIMAIGGVFGVMNTMFAAISQRTKDIGVLRILGFARWQILCSFFLETLVIALTGGLLGCFLGSLSNGWTATSIVSAGQGGGKTVILKLVVDGTTIAIGVLFTLVMGSLGGFVPALSAMRQKPLDSLR